MARFPSIDNDGAFEAPEVQDQIKHLVTGTTQGITVDTTVGTRVFVGDTMIFGDTGWRDCKTLLHPDFLDLTWDDTRFDMKRENDTVYFIIRVRLGSASTGRNATSIIPITRSIPSQLVQAPATYGEMYFGSMGQRIIRAENKSSHQHLNIVTALGSTPWAEGEIFTARITYTSTRSWPTSLPGSPA